MSLVVIKFYARGFFVRNAVIFLRVIIFFSTDIIFLTNILRFGLRAVIKTFGFFRVIMQVKFSRHYYYSFGGVSIMGKKVLIVDDAAFMRMMLKDILTKNDFEVVAEAENGKAGVAAFQKYKPDIITMDITMPEMNGIDAVKAIKAIDPNVKVVMVSAMGQQPMVIEAIQAGANDFIVKPFQPERVIEAITKVLS